MPGGPTLEVQSYLIFGGIKLGGYTLAGWFLNRAYKNSTANFFLVGLTRTVLGMIIGAGVGLAAFPVIVFLGGLGCLVYVLGLIPVRLFEWFVIIRIFYDRNQETRDKNWAYARSGTLWSFILDIPALVGFVSTGGFWIC